jgi:hypothetical protein
MQELSEKEQEEYIEISKMASEVVKNESHGNR